MPPATDNIARTERSLELGAIGSNSGRQLREYVACRKKQDDAAKLIARQLANADIETALTWAQKLPAGAARQDALDPIISQWSKVIRPAQPILP